VSGIEDQVDELLHSDSSKEKKRLSYHNIWVLWNIIKRPNLQISSIKDLFRNKLCSVAQACNFGWDQEDHGLNQSSLKKSSWELILTEKVGHWWMSVILVTEGNVK
jgi:hypothetical protein